MTATSVISYFLLFNHGPPEDIMSANRYKKESARFFPAKREEHMDDLEKHVHVEKKKAFQYWENFITENKFVPIGEVYDNCGMFCAIFALSFFLSLSKDFILTLKLFTK